MLVGYAKIIISLILCFNSWSTESRKRNSVSDHVNFMSSSLTSVWLRLWLMSTVSLFSDWLPSASSHWNTQDHSVLIAFIMWDRDFSSNYELPKHIRTCFLRSAPNQQLCNQVRAYREQNWAKDFSLNWFVNIIISAQFIKTL